MPVPDSLRLKKESLQCEAAAKIADFLESYYIPPHCYDFVLPDLLCFECQETLLKLRELAVWQALETDFKAVGGWIKEDWDDEADEPTIAPIEKASPSQPIQKAPRWIDLIIATIAVSALLGASLGWFYPWFSFPVLSRPDDTTADR